MGEVRVFEGGAPIPCGDPPPTVAATDLIRVADPTRGSSSLEIDLRGGLFGSTPFIVDLGFGTSDELRIIGSDGADHLVLSGGGIDLDGSGQLDVGMTGVEIHEIESGGGADRIDAGGDANSDPFPARLLIDGGTGNDVIDGGDAGDLLRGGEGSDVLRGENGPDRLEGRDGPDGLEGGLSDDVLVGGPGDDLETGGNGDDLFLQGTESEGGDAISGGIGDLDVVAYDRRTSPLVARIGNGLPDDGESGELDEIRDDVEGVLGGASDDMLVGDGGPNHLLGGPGDDGLEGRGGSDVLDGGSGTNLLDGGSGSDTVTCAEAPGPVVVDLVSGTASGHGADTLGDIENAIGGAFADTLTGTSGANDLFGRGGRDRLLGDEGADTLVGGTGPDRLVGGPGSDKLDGGAANDRLQPGPGDDVVDGGAGPDLLDLVSSPVGVVVDLARGSALGEGSDMLAEVSNVRGSSSRDDLRGTRLSNRLIGAGGRDVIRGAGGPDRISGGTGNDHLLGGAGHDRVLGKAGRDVLMGGSGSDRLDGGAGFDRCRQGPGKGRERRCEA